MSDLMDTKKVRTVKNKCEDGGKIEHNEYTLDQSKYVGVRLPDGKLINGTKLKDESDDTMMDW